ncbi:hypothetical protein ACFYO0_00860 [Streptomyces sp. NPDC006365]|uniref:hypothetical protein n=1 Tax=Streptomyces sp. NPDC006365 TaxID=3364744 RepID=UPI003698446C
MFACIHTMNRRTSHPGLDGVADGYVLEEVGRSRTTVVSLWPTQAGARAAAAAGVLGATVVRDEVYQVEEDIPGPAAADEPGAAALLDFDGPQGPARIAAARRAFHNRLGPVLRQTPGLVRVLVLWQPETCAHVVLTIAVSLPALADIGKAVDTTQLLPGEDPALLPGPDRAAINQITAHRQGVLR